MIKNLGIAFAVATSIFLQSCAVPLKPGAENVRIVSDSERSKCKLIKVINTYDVGLKYSGDSIAEGAQNNAKNQVLGAGGNAMKILSINNQEVKGKMKVYITVEALKCL